MESPEERYTGRGSERRIADELMGKVVMATARFQKEHLDSDSVKDGVKNTIVQRKVPVKNPIVGWVVGVRRLPIGKVTGGWYSDEPAEFHQTETVTALMVATWVSRSPVYIPLDSFEFTDVRPKTGLSWNDLGISEEVQERLRDEFRQFAETMPRGEGGKFLPSED